jgi:thiamine biosynthesis protein ThiS
MAISIYLNGKKENLDENTTVSKLLEIKKIRLEVVTVEVNDEIVKKEDYGKKILKEGDKVEFVYYMGGGCWLIALGK